MDTSSPPRKKLKQARLPFQILSPKDSTPDTSVSGTSRKCQLSEESKDNAVTPKVKKSEEFKENKTTVPPSNDVTPDSNDVILIEESENEDNLKDLNGSTLGKNESLSSQESGSVLQGQMKSNLSFLIGKKSFDITADVGSCDCGCEEDNSEEEALKEYLEHTNNEKHDSPNKSSTGKVRKKPSVKDKKSHKRHSKTKSDAANSQDSKGRLIESGKDVPPEPGRIAPDESADKVVSGTSNSLVKPTTLEKSGMFSKKAIDLFAKWKKGGNNNSDVKEAKDIVDNVKVQEQLNPQENKEMKKEADDDEKLNEIKSDLMKEKSESSIENGKITPATTEVVNAGTGSPPMKKMKEDSKSKTQDSSIHSRSVEKVESENDHSTISLRLSPSKELTSSTDSPILVDLEDSPCPLTPTSVGKIPHRRLTPKQLERQRETLRKQEEKEKLKLERELEKKRLKQEKDDLKRKEKEEKEEQRRKEKEEKEKKKQEEQEQKIEERKKKELHKAEEKRRKEEERKKLDEEKKKAEEEEERKKAKASAMFTSFFVSKTSKNDRDETPTVQNFMPFEVKAGMRIAPSVRTKLDSPQKKLLDEAIESGSCKPRAELYLHILKSGKVIPKSDHKTWPIDEIEDDDDDVCVLDADDDGVLISNNKNVEKMRAKFLQFHENHRPAYRGTWRKKSSVVTGRRPFGQEKILDYEVDSADEWEEEEPGESLHGSDDEKEKESEDEYEVDNSVFVPHGYLSEDEGDDENEEILSPETQKAKLKLLGEEFEAQMKSKTSALKPIIIMLTAALQASSIGSTRYQKLLERRAVWQEDEGPIMLSKLNANGESSDGQAPISYESQSVTFSSGPGAKKKIISEEAIPALITLIHGNQNKRVFLTNEFSAFLGKSRSVQTENLDENAKSDESADRPGTPSSSAPNPLLMKWPGLPPASRISISNKIKELSTWGPCPEEGPLYNRQCWFVSEEVREKYGMKDLKVPNTIWHYSLKPKIFSHSSSPNANATLSSASVTDSRALITKFTKVMTPEDKQRQWESMKNSAANTPSSSKLLPSKGSVGKITAFTQQVKSAISSTSESKQRSPLVQQSGSSALHTFSSSQPQAKKRVPLLVSVPRGHQISSSSHCSLLSKFEASTAATPTASATASESTADSTSVQRADPPSSRSGEEDCIVLD